MTVLETLLSGQLLFAALVTGSLYALIALGLNLVYGTMRLLNVAHGEVVMLGAYAAYWAFSAFGLSPLLVAPVVAAAGGLLGYALYRGIFKGLLAIFLLEMGLVAASRLGDLRRAGPFLLSFAIVMPLCAGLLGILTARFIDLSLGGTVLLATLYASASYIAAPAAMRIAVPEANPALSVGAALGITFPFNLLIGIPLYHWAAMQLR